MPKLIKTMQLFKYSPNIKGMCFGISVMAAQAALRKDNIVLANRIKFIQNCTEAEIETIKNSEIDNELNFNKKLELMCFFDGISMYQGAGGVNAEFKSIAPSIQNINDTIDIIKSKASENDDKFTYPEIKIRLVNTFTFEEFLHFIKQIKKSVDQQPFSIIINHFPIAHATQIGFDEKNWLSIDHDLILLGEDNSEDVEKIANNVFHPVRYGSTDHMVAIFDILLPEVEYIDSQPFEAYDFSPEVLTDSFDKEMLSHILASYLEIFRYDAYLAILQKISILPLTKNEKIAFIESTDKDNTTALHYIAYYGKSYLLEQMFKTINCLGLSLETKISIVNKKNNKGLSALYYAAQNSHIEVVKILLDLGTSISEQSLKADFLNAGKSALFVAAKNGHKNVVKALVKAISSLEDYEARTALLTSTNKEGESALSIAARRKHNKIVKLLRTAIKKEKRLSSQKNCLIFIK